MSREITLSMSALSKLIDAVGYPDPEGDWDPRGPIGPIANPWRRFAEIMLNPQPLPPIIGPFPDPWQRLSWSQLNPQPLPPIAGPFPEPWRAATMARVVVGQVVAQYCAAEVLSGDNVERAFEMVRANLHDYVDEWCGNRPPKWPFPWPWPGPPPWELNQMDGVSLLAAGIQFDKAAQFEGPLQSDFAAAAEQLIDAGVNRLA